MLKKKYNRYPDTCLELVWNAIKIYSWKGHGKLISAQPKTVDLEFNKINGESLAQGYSFD